MARSKLYPPSVDPGFPILPPTPKGWARLTFGDVVQSVERPVTLVPTASYRLVTAKRNRGGIVSRGEMLGREILTKTQFEIRAGDFLISRRQIIHGACGVVPSELDGAIVSGEYSALRTRSALLMEFLAHYCHTPYFQRTCFHSSHGVDVEKMIFKIDEWLAREVDVPPDAEQRKIATILSSVDDAIESTQAVIDQLQVVKKAMMAELLTRGLPGRHTRFKHTKIGEVPEAWDVLSGEFLFTLSGGHAPSDIIFSAAGDALFLKVDDFNRPTNQRGLQHAALRYDPAKNPRIKTYTPGHLIFPKRGAAIFKNRVQVLNQAGTVDPNLMVLATGPRLDATFFKYEMLHVGLHNLGDNSGIPQINNKHLYPHLFAVPPLEEQRALGEVIDSIDSRIEAEQSNSTALVDAKSALISVLLTGEVRVTPDDEPAAPRRKRSPIGWLADRPELADALLRNVIEGRAADRMRDLDLDDDEDTH
jgi:type I restriction enzyme, S subunit